VLIDLVGFGIALPLLPLWAERLGASPFEVGLLLASYAICQVIFAPLWGRASDRYGRRPVILVALAGASAAALLTGLASTLWLLFVARALHGAAGASYVAAQAYVADVTRPGERARGLGLIGAAFGLGFTIGPALGALLSTVGPRTPFFVVAALSAANLAWAYARLPESRSATVATRVRGGVRAMLRRPERRGVLVVSLVATAAFVGVEATFALFAADRLGYAELGVGLLFAFIGIVAASVQGGLIGPVVRRFGERRVLVGGLTATAAGALGVALAGSLWLMLPALAVLAAGWGFAYSATLALASLTAAADEQGAVLGALGSVGGVGRILGPIAGAAAYQLVAPAAPLVLTAAVLLATALATPALLGRMAGGRAAADGDVGPPGRDIRPGETP
jgi:multidrug resistance protein